MKPDQESQNQEAEAIAGDIIGDTAYSERFVLKLLLKFANLDTLREEVQEKSFEEDLCTLWDMTAERDVVLFLLRHKILNLFNFALPVLESPRILEIVIGITGNMCCQKEVVTELLKMDGLLKSLMEYIKTDDSLILIQVIRLVNSSMFISDDADIPKWLEIFELVEYNDALYFILKNSSNKNLLINALENLNTLCSYCNNENNHTKFFTMFIKADALKSLTMAFIEINVTQNESFDKEELERVQVISLQICLNLIGFEHSSEVYASVRDDLVTMITIILNYYYDKIKMQKEVDSDLVDIIDSVSSIVNILQLSEACSPDKYFEQCFSIWQAVNTITTTELTGNSSFDNDTQDLETLSKEIELQLSMFLCQYMEKCHKDHLLRIIDKIGIHYDSILNTVEDEELKAAVCKRTENYRSRLKDNVDS